MSNSIIPKLSDYSTKEVSSAKLSAPILNHYLSLIEQTSSAAHSSIYLNRLTAFCECVLANYFAKASEQQVCRHWSEIADSNIRYFWKEFGLDKMPVAVFAVGKLGASELNLSSDIDLMLIAADGTEINKRSISNFINALMQSTELGFLHRVDVDLRPGGRLGPLVSSVAQFQDYYGNFGETWERLSLIRLRAIAGDPEVVKQIEEFIPRFCYRKHLDYTLLEDLKGLRKKIQHHYASSDSNVFNIKLGIGGIRDIELFVHSLQVIHGGRIPSLRTRSTSAALKEISKHELLPNADAEFLLESYWAFRHLENNVQSLQDQQTHMVSLPNADLVSRAERVDKLVSSLLGAVRPESDIPSEYDEQIKWLTSKGLSGPSVEEHWKDLVHSKVLSRKKEQDEAQRLLFLQNFVLELQTLDGDKDLAFSLLVDFVKATRAKATFFTLFNRRQDVIKDLAWLFSISPYLSHILISRPELIDSYLLKVPMEISRDLSLSIDQLGDFKQLNELLFSSRFLIDQDVGKLVEGLTVSADNICRTILEITKSEVPDSSLQLLTMGKWAGKELGLRSDLDFVFVTSRPVSEADHKVGRRIVTRLTQKNKGGALYSLDFRLRPSGNAGLIVVSQDQLENYLLEDAKIWERQAYLKSRMLDQEAFPSRNLAVQKTISTNEISDLREIKSKLLKQNQASNLDVKFSPGGLVDIEFTYQWTALKDQINLKGAGTEASIAHIMETNAKWKYAGTTIIQNHNFLRTVEQLHQLLTASSGIRLDHNSKNFQTVAQLLQMPPSDLKKKIELTLAENIALLKDLDPFSAKI